jgi:hypothetical protein
MWWVPAVTGPLKVITHSADSIMQKNDLNQHNINVIILTAYFTVQVWSNHKIVISMKVVLKSPPSDSILN